MNSAPGPLATALADRYRIERELGQGGMATVYLAEDLNHHRKVAVKVLLAGQPPFSGATAESLVHQSTGAETLVASNAADGGEAIFAAWSPDGTRHYYTSSSARVDGKGGQRERRP